MTQAALAHYQRLSPPPQVSSLTVTCRGHGLPAKGFEILEAGHPLPDHMSIIAAERALVLANQAAADDLVLVLVSGGASALWAAPIAGVGLEDKQRLTDYLLKSGAPISEINCIRKHLSRIKGGRLALAAAPAELVTLAISDVAGDDPSTIGSGPSVGDPTSQRDAAAIFKNRGIPVNAGVTKALGSAKNETPSPDHPALAGSAYRIVAKPASAIAAAALVARSRGYEPVKLGSDLEGDARVLAKRHAAHAVTARNAAKRTVLLSGGEATVQIHGDGRGGPNQEFALALACELDGAQGIWALAADTDGADGGISNQDDPAGAMIGPQTLARARDQGLDPQKFLENNDSTGFFAALGDLLITGPTFTNVNDFRAILIEP